MQADEKDSIIFPNLRNFRSSDKALNLSFGWVNKI